MKLCFFLDSSSICSQSIAIRWAVMQRMTQWYEWNCVYSLNGIERADILFIHFVAYRALMQAVGLPFSLCQSLYVLCFDRLLTTSCSASVIGVEKLGLGICKIEL